MHKGVRKMPYLVHFEQNSLKKLTLGKKSSTLLGKLELVWLRNSRETSIIMICNFWCLQLVCRQIAKLNHRLMAVELENQQQQQREMIFTVLVTAYFFGKFIFWVNR